MGIPSFIFHYVLALIEANALQTAKQLLVNLGGWPVLEGTFWNEYRFDWKTTMFQFRKIGLGIDTLFDLSVGFDLKNSNRRIIQVGTIVFTRRQ